MEHSRVACRLVAALADVLEGGETPSHEDLKNLLPNCHIQTTESEHLHGSRTRSRSKHVSKHLVIMSDASSTRLLPLLQDQEVFVLERSTERRHQLITEEAQCEGAASVSG